MVHAVQVEEGVHPIPRLTPRLMPRTPLTHSFPDPNPTPDPSLPIQQQFSCHDDDDVRNSPSSPNVHLDNNSKNKQTKKKFYDIP